jgi:hypothetical protein
MPNISISLPRSTEESTHIKNRKRSLEARDFQKWLNRPLTKSFLGYVLLVAGMNGPKGLAG